jgi:hypothetical protein
MLKCREVVKKDLHDERNLRKSMSDLHKPLIPTGIIGIDSTIVHLTWISTLSQVDTLTCYDLSQLRGFHDAYGRT